MESTAGSPRRPVPSPRRCRGRADRGGSANRSSAARPRAAAASPDRSTRPGRCSCGACAKRGLRRARCAPRPSRPSGARSARHRPLPRRNSVRVHSARSPRMPPAAATASAKAARSCRARRRCPRAGTGAGSRPRSALPSWRRARGSACCWPRSRSQVAQLLRLLEPLGEPSRARTGGRSRRRRRGRSARSSGRSMSTIWSVAISRNARSSSARSVSAARIRGRSCAAPSIAASSEPCFCSSSAAVFGPIPGAPGQAVGGIAAQSDEVGHELGPDPVAPLDLGRVDLLEAARAPLSGRRR